MKKVICIGSATKDIFVEIDGAKVIENNEDVTEKRLFVFEFGAKIYAQSCTEEVGGSAVNVAAGLSKCDLKSFVMARSSKSENGKWIVKQIGKKKLKKNYFQQTGGRESQVSVVISDNKNKDHVIFRTGDSVESFDVAKSLEKFREKVDWIFVGSQKSNWETNFKQIVAFAKKKKAKIALNPSGYQISNYAKELSGVLKFVDVLFVNRDEALEFVKNLDGKVEDQVKVLFERIVEFFGGVCVITDGAEGAYVCEKNSHFYHIPTQAVTVSDTVGAGDAFSSAFLAEYIESEDIKKSLVWGIANSASVISKKGSTNGLLKKKELKKLEQELLGKVTEI